MKRLFCLLCIGLLASACGGDKSAKELCKDSASVGCSRAYECFTAEQLAALGFPATEAGCVTQVEEVRGCAAITNDTACVGNQTFHPDQAEKCIDQTAAASCAQIASGDDSAAPACALVCVTE